MRYAAGVEYDGSRYAGWQIQPHAPSVQAAVETALGHVANHPVRTVCAGRTDSGVHALGQVVHFDSPAQRSPRAWVFGANSRLPADISLGWACQVPEGFHARYSAIRRRYRYLIYDQPARSALCAGRAAVSRYRLDAPAMHAAAQLLIGEHDFSAFRAAACQSRSPWRRLERLEFSRRGPLVVMDITANAFLHHMVRNLAGTLMQVGRGLQSLDWPQRVLEDGVRARAGATAAACGLYLIAVSYPDEYALPTADPDSPGLAPGLGW